LGIHLFFRRTINDEPRRGAAPTLALAAG
jgi:hypothetical protein